MTTTWDQGAPPPPLEGARWLAGAEDEARLIALLRACYGDTYGHRSLYSPGGFTALWSSGQLLSLGAQAPSGALVAHTGLWRKDPADDFVESGLSLTIPAAPSGVRGDRTGGLWPWLFGWLQQRAAFLHQQTTTLHVAAQGYALHLMRAAFAGWVPAYTTGEQLATQPPAPPVMHALMMTTALQPLPEAHRSLPVPEGPWGRWLAALAPHLQLTAHPAPWDASASTASPLPAALLEEAPGLGLRRRRLGAGEGADLGPSPWRVELLHQPATPEAIGAFTAPLLAAGYAPVGVRPAAARPHELVWWRGPADLDLTHMALARPAWEAQIQAWMHTARAQ